MDVSAILNDLNEAQRQAVSAPLGHLRVIAGAGSGKTRVLVHRIAWLMALENASPYGILAVTFTNKAAGEMRGRLEAMLGYAVSGFWVGTFHSICHRMLRAHHARLGLIADFAILDRDDQLRLIKRIMKANGINEQLIKARQIANMIGQYKEAGKRHNDLPNDNLNTVEKMILFIYEQYERHCQEHHLVDFTELLLRVVELLRDDKLIREHYQSRFQHILVDEFQDTNSIQFAFIQLLTRDNTDMLVVGDDDQSIYAFRGAKIEHILDLQRFFPKLTTIKLEQNYRSSGHILSAANAVISKNSERLKKNLWTQSTKGEKIEIYPSINEYDETYYVSERIRSHIASGGRYTDITILYRSNAQSRLFEETLLSDNIPYRIYGGLRFFDRAEIKDAIAYLRLSENRHDDVAFDRIVNVPTRGIGIKTLDNIRQIAAAQQLSLWQATEQALANQALSARANQALGNFQQLINSLQCDNVPLVTYIKIIIDGSGLMHYYKNQKKIDKREDKVDNLEELINAAAQFSHRLDEADKDSAISLFLAQTALDAGETQASEYSDYVQLMTLHAAKGLEFPIVFMVGVEEGLFPRHESAMNPEQLAEERRLAYVGMTRTEKKLHISYSEKRRIFGEAAYPRPSRFIAEIPEDILCYVRGGPVHTKHQQSSKSTDFSGDTGRHQRHNTGHDIRLGQRIEHPTYGDGVITAVEGQDERQRIEVNFTEHGSKWLILAFTKLTFIP